MKIEVKVFDTPTTNNSEALPEGTLEAVNIFEINTELIGCTKINCTVLDKVCEQLIQQPVFIFLAQDKFSPQFIRSYRDFLKEAKNQVWKRVDTALRSINEWRKNHKDRIKIPD